MSNDREKAIAWWKELPSSEKLILWENWMLFTYTLSFSPEELTGREIEEIYKQQQ